MARRQRRGRPGVEEEEIVDLNTLPPWTPFAFKLYFHPYMDEEFKENLQEVLDENLKQMIITRADLEQYAKDFGYVGPPGQEENQSEGQGENPKLWARVFGKKMFYSDVAGMREKQTRLEAEEDISDAEEPVVEEDQPDYPDVTYQIEGYPSTREEMESVTQSQTAYQLALYIRPSDRIIVRKSKQEASDPPDELSQDFVDLTHAIRDTHRNSPWRNCLTRVNIYKENDESTEEALNLIVEQILQTSERYLEYTKWLKSTAVTPLCPLQPPDSPGYQEERGSHGLSSIDSLPSATPAATPKQQRSQKQFSVAGSSHNPSAKHDDIMSHFQSHNLEPEMIEEIPSADDDAMDWNFDTYYSKVNAVGDSCMSTGVILRCMMQQLTEGVAQTNKLEVDLEKILAQHLEVKNAEKKKSNIAAAQGTAIDFSNTVAFRHRSNPVLADEEMKLLKTQQVPGVNRFLMPKEAQLSFKNRHLRSSQFLAYVTMPIWDLNQAMQITHFEQLLDGIYDFSDRIYEERFCTSQLVQIIAESMLPEPTIAAHYDETADQIYVAIHYETPVERHGQLEWSEDSRARPSFQVWEPEVDYDTNFLDVDEFSIGGLNETVNMVYGFDQCVYKHITYSVGKETLDQELNPEIKQRNYAIKDDVSFGFYTDGAFWIRFKDSSRVLVDKQEGDVSFTVVNNDGLVVKQYLCGTVQQFPGQVKPGPSAEISRTITRGGTVIKNLAGDRQILLFANGNYCVHTDDKWISTNNAGDRICRSSTGMSNLTSVPFSNVTDPKTNISTMLREDSTMRVNYPDGSINTLYGDGTCMHTYPDGKILVEAQGYAPTEINKSRTTLYLSDGSVCYHDDNQIKFVRPDGFEMVLNPDETAELKNCTSPGIQYVDLSKCIISSKSEEGDYFELSRAGVDVQLHEKSKASNEDEDETEEEQEERQNDVKTLVTPRLFLINNKNEGHELLSADQLKKFKQHYGEANFVCDNDFDLKPDKRGWDKVAENPEDADKEEIELKSQVLSWVKEIVDDELTQGHIPKSPIIDFEVPDIVRPVQQVHPPTLHQFSKHTIYRQIFQNQDFTEKRRKAFNAEIENFEKWKKLQAARSAEFGTMTKLKKESLEIEFGIQEKIINLRRQPEQYKSYEEFKQNMQSAVDERIIDQQASLSDLAGESSASLKPDTAQSHPKTPGFGQNQRPKRVRYPSDIDYNQRNYFQTAEGQKFLQNEPPKPIQKDASLYELTEVNPDDLTKQERKGFDSIQESFSQSLRSKVNTTVEAIDAPKFDSSMVTPIPKNTNNRKKMYSPRTITLTPVETPSCFNQIDQLERMKQDTEEYEAADYVYRKSKNFANDGNSRRRIPKPRSIRRSNVSCEPNSSYILNESMTDRRGRTSSMATSFSHRAPSISSVRRDGTHTIMEKAWRKKWSPEQLRDSQVSMISAVTTDRLARNLLVTPGQVRFGTVKAGMPVEVIVVLKNEDSQIMRIAIRQPRDTNVKVKYSPRPLALGMELKLHVELNATSAGSIDTSFSINAKSQKYHLPITATVISESEWEEHETSMANMGQAPLRRTVRLVASHNNVKARSSRRSSNQSEIPKLPSIKQVKDDISVASSNMMQEELKRKSRMSNYSSEFDNQ